MFRTFLETLMKQRSQKKITESNMEIKVWTSEHTDEQMVKIVTKDKNIRRGIILRINPSDLPEIPGNWHYPQYVLKHLLEK
jgi:hypothetical protein